MKVIILRTYILELALESRGIEALQFCYKDVCKWDMKRHATSISNHRRSLRKTELCGNSKSYMVTVLAMRNASQDRRTRRKARYKNKEATFTVTQDVYDDFTFQGYNRLRKSNIGLYNHTGCSSTNSTNATSMVYNHD